MIHTLYINDHNLLIQGADSVARSQGYAWLNGDSVLFDCNSENIPVNSCRLAPQQINSRYWQQCAQSSITPNEAGMRHAADLIWRHLSELKTRHSLEQVVLVVPSHYQAANLQLLLGIAKSCGLQARGLINKAVAALQNSAVTGECLHIDVQLHQSVCTQVSVNDGLVKSGTVEVLQNVGIQAMQDALLRALQESYIQNDRFDPLHYAETEQQLFDQLDSVAKELQDSSKAMVTVQYQDRLHRTNIDAKLWSSTLAPFFEEVFGQASDSQSVFIDMNGAFQNCVLPELKGPNATVISIPENANLASTVASDNADQAVTYRTELATSALSREAPKQSPKSPEPPAPSAPVATATQAQKTNTTQTKAVKNKATHLLQFGIAVPIERAELRTAANQLSLHENPNDNAQSLLDAGQIFVMNDESRQYFEPNDRLGSHMADGVITVIQVL